MRDPAVLGIRRPNLPFGWSWLAVVLGGGGFLALAILVAPEIAAALALGALLLAHAWAHPRAYARHWVLFLAFVLLGYATLGRGFAYVGAPPLYVGEAALATGLVAVLAVGGLGRVFRSPVSWLLVVFMAWGAFCTLPYLGTHGMAALRDAVLWGYGVFALIVAAVLLRTGWWRRIVPAYASWLPFLVLWVPLGLLLTEWATDRFGGGALVPQLKPGDAAVHLTGIGAFLLLGLYSARDRGRGWLEWAWTGVWLIGFLFAATQNRGGMVSAAIGLGLVLLFRPTHRWLKIALPALVLGAVLVAADVEVEMGGRREISARQLAQNALSVVGVEPEGESLQSTVDWRLQWWSDIVDYTVFGSHFWTGKGYGVNLADSDGYQVDQRDSSLRSPHNGHLSVLARSGVPGFALWILLHGAFAVVMVRSHLRESRDGREAWARFDLWILAFWAAFMVNATFDVFLEGPMGGIWFWSIMGAAIATLEARNGESGEEMAS
ncbi:MAG: O-antigen ligase family protein [Gemmatimonadota bacterium]|nr:O-antigen ligase family protein [Gemmatimonadota bacterium]